MEGLLRYTSNRAMGTASLTGTSVVSACEKGATKYKLLMALRTRAGICVVQQGSGSNVTVKAKKCALLRNGLWAAATHSF